MTETLTIKDLQVDLKVIPLTTPFVTALHRVDSINAVRVRVALSNGIVGTGTCTPNEKVTGDTINSAAAVIKEVIRPLLLGQDFGDWRRLLQLVQASIVHNGPAKAAVELALYDAKRQLLGISLTELLGGKGGSVHTDYTISIGDPDQMIAEGQKRVEAGFKSLKLKLGHGHADRDIKLVEDFAYAVGPMIHLRLDMNQAWSARETLAAANYWKKHKLAIDFIEQPVPAGDLDAMAWLTKTSPYPIMADEAVESYLDAQKVVEKRAADYINIKLMKTGGLSEAQKINDLAESRGIKTMVGCMIESIESISAACSFVLANPNVVFADLDSVFMADQDPDMANFAVAAGDTITVK